MLNESKDALQSYLLQNELSDSLIQSGSSLMVWKDSPDFLALTERTLEQTYGAFPKGDLHREVERRLVENSGTTNWLIWFDTGLMSMAAERYDDAILCFSESIKDAELMGNPYPLAYIARAKLRLSEVEDALASYDAAIQQASSSPAVKLQISFMEAMDLYDARKIGRVFDKSGPVKSALLSEYPLERCFGLYESLLHAWSEDATAEIPLYLSDLQATLPLVTVNVESAFEERRFRQASELAQRVAAALGGDPIAEMILDEECCDFYLKNDEWDRARDRLKPWTEIYPISQYDQWDFETKDAVTWVNLNYLLSEVVLENHALAQQGFNVFISSVSEEEFPRKVIEAYLWLGCSHLESRNLTEAANAFEIGLEKDSFGSISMSDGLPIDNLQPRIVGGKIRYQTRKDFVKLYSDTLLRLKEEASKDE